MGTCANSAVESPGARRRAAAGRKLAGPSAKERLAGVRKPLSPTKEAGSAATRRGKGRELGLAAPQPQQRLVVRVQRAPAVAVRDKALLGAEGPPAREGWGLGGVAGAQ